jgi:hypothetical protein
VHLYRCPTEVYGPGECYRQEAEEIHESRPANGTLTLIHRRFKEDTEHARVFWQSGGFVSAEPRPAKEWEIQLVRVAALAQLDAAEGRL